MYSPRVFDDGYRVFSTGRVVATLGSSLGPLTLTFAVLQGIRHSPASTLALVLTAQTIAQLVALIVGGSLIDRLERRRYIVSCQSLGCFGYLLLAVAVSAHSSAFLIVVGVVLGVLAGLNGPSLQSVMPHLVSDKDRLQRKNADLRIALNVVQVGGPALGGVVLAAIDIRWGAVYIAVMFIAAGIVFSRLPAIPAAHRTHMLADLAAGWTSFVRTRWFLVIVGACAVMNILWVMYYQVIGPAQTHSGAGHSGIRSWGLVTASLAAGLIIGGFLFRNRTFAKPLQAGMIGLAAKALLIVAVGLDGGSIVTCVAAFAAGVGTECFAINFYTEVQKRIPDGTLGKMLSIDAFVGIGLTPIGLLVGPVAASSPHLSTIAWISAAATVVVAVSAASALTRLTRERVAVG